MTSTLNTQLVRADFGKVFGNTVIITTKFCYNNQCSKKPNIDKYYFSKDGKKVFTEADYFGKQHGYIYGLSNEICVDLKSSYSKKDKNITVEDTHCGVFHLDGGIITIVDNNISRDPGFGTTKSIYELILEVSNGGKCRLVKYAGKATNPGGTTYFKMKGTCKINEGRHI